MTATMLRVGLDFKQMQIYSGYLKQANLLQLLTMQKELSNELVKRKKMVM